MLLLSKHQERLNFMIIVLPRLRLAVSISIEITRPLPLSNSPLTLKSLYILHVKVLPFILKRLHYIIKISYG